MLDATKRQFLVGKRKTEKALRLPWLKDVSAFTDNCTRCGKCQPVCETQIIKLGDGGFPVVDFALGECIFCYQCADACPENLFTEQTAAPWQARAEIAATCLAQQNVECRSCGDMCEPMAIRFRFEVGKVAQPMLQTEDCNGCGACVSACPTSAISVFYQMA